MWTKVRLVNLFAFIGITFPIPIHHLILSGSAKIPIKVPYISTRLGLWQVQVTFFFFPQGTKVTFQSINLFFLVCNFPTVREHLYNSSVTFNRKRPNEVFKRKKIYLKYENVPDCNKYYLF